MGRVPGPGRIEISFFMSFYFSVGEQDPCEVYIVVDGKPVFYKRCETPEIARVVVDGQNNSRRIDQ